MRIAVLTTVFIGEYGVTRVLANQLPYLLDDGHRIDLFACDLDRRLVPRGVHAVRVPTHFKGIPEALRAGRYDVVIACTDPFFKIVADLKLDAVTIAYEHGYIPVELTIPEEREQHRRMVEARVGEIYPAFTAVVTISHYAAQYIRWPAAMVLYNGGDHFAKMLPRSAPASAGAKLRVLAVTRFRTTEWLYKGLDDLCRLKNDLGDGYEVIAVGGGDESTYAKLRQAGVDARPAISNAREMAELYYGCDVLVSFSRCENFNLPLVEAGFARKPALALNVCAHPEVTPFVFDGYDSIRDYLKTATRESLVADGEKMFRFVDAQFRSVDNGKRFAQLVDDLCPEPLGRHARPSFFFRWAFWVGREMVRKVYKKWRGR